MRAPRLGILAALALTACGPYVNVAERLDVTVPITGGETWIAANADGTDVRLLVMPDSLGGVPAAFSLVSAQFPVSSGTSVSALQGEWVDRGGAASFRVLLEYVLPDERDEPVLSRRGSSRREVDRTLEVDLERADETLVLSGDAELSGAYVRFRDAAAALGSTTEHDAACAFQIANLAMRATHVRILGFGGPTMTSYRDPATFVGTLGGAFEVAFALDSNTATFVYAGLVELGGTHLDGVQATDADFSGNGTMSGAVTIRIVPRGPGGEDLASVATTIDYGGGGDPNDRVTISAGVASGGHYVSTLPGGGAARVSPVTPPSPSLTECLALP
jgi:hypothetical protein